LTHNITIDSSRELLLKQLRLIYFLILAFNINKILIGSKKMKILYLFASFFVYSIAFDEFVRKNATFVALVPKVVRRNYNYSVAVKPVNIESSVEVTVKLYGVNPNFTLETIKTLDPGKYAVLSLGKVPAQISEPEELFFSLIGRYKNISSQNNSKLNDSTQNVFSVYIPEKLEKDLRFFMPRKKLIFESKSSSLLIETDRGIYKPGQTGTKKLTKFIIYELY